MKHFGLRFLFLCVLLHLVNPSGVFATGIPTAPEGTWLTTTAYQTGVAFSTNGGLNPHYGAFFIGGWGQNQHYLGTGGDADTCNSGSGCINVWNWWGPSLSVLLIPKFWWVADWRHKLASNYQAQMYI